MRRVSLLAAMIAASLIATISLGGYSKTGHKWPTADVPFFVNTANKRLSESAVLTALQNAASHWTTQSGANIRFTYAGKTSGSSLVNNGINEVFFRNTSNGSYSALTYSWYDGSGRMVDADTVFYEGTYNFYAGSTGCLSSGIYLEDVATHEFGHSLGLNHASDTTATMHSKMPTWCTLLWRTLANDDIAGIRAIYPASSGTVPNAPTTLAATAGTPPEGAVKLTWVDKANNESATAIERSTNGTSFSKIGQVGTNVVTFTNTGLTAATKYWYRVYATNSTGPSAYSAIVSITTAAAGVPPAVTNPSPANGATNVVTTTISWAPAPGATHYSVYFGTTASPPLKATGRTSTTWSTGTLAKNTKYYWKITSRNSAGYKIGPTWSFTTRAY